MGTVIDLHSHVLPGIDDGSASVAESIDMLRMEAEQGITHVVATPHFYPRHDDPHRFLQRRAEAEARLREEMAKHTGLPELTVGAEVHYFSGISSSEIVSELTIGGKKCILIEMPHSPWTKAMYRELEEIPARFGITPIIAHVDRYIGPWRTFGIPERLEELPVLVQANASFFRELSTASMAMRMLRQEQIHLLGSDCHNCHDRKPNLGGVVERIEKRLGSEALARIHEFERFVLQPDGQQ